MVGAIHSEYPTILILDFGSQYSHLITRRCRELQVYAEMLPCTQKLDQLDWAPAGVILSGSPYSVYDHGAPHVDPKVFELAVPVLGICYGLQEIAWQFSGPASVEAHDEREYGHATLQVSSNKPHPLFARIDQEMQVWMSHGDRLKALPLDFEIIAQTSSAPFAAIVHKTRQIYGIQFHPEVSHTPKGIDLLRNFVIHICQCPAVWTMDSFVSKEIARIKDLVGPTGQVIGAVSGGVDSTVAAKLMTQAIGDRFHAILVDNGLLRQDEAKKVKETLTEHLGIHLHVFDGSQQFLSRLAGVSDPEKKRKIIGNTFIEIFQAEGLRMEKESEVAASTGLGGSKGKIEWLLQGTLYPDVIESISFKGPSATIKTHHNVGGLLENMHLKLIEPLRELFKDEVRALGTLLGIPEDLVWRHPFPGPGLAIRILGAVDAGQLAIARKADHIFMEEIVKAGLYRSISQAYAALLPIQTVGVMGDKRTYQQAICLRAVKTNDFMTATAVVLPSDVLARISNRIVNEVDGVNRVMIDVTSKPPATIEME